MTLLHIGNAIGHLYPDYKRMPEPHGLVCRLTGYARFAASDSRHRKVRLDARGWMAEEDGQRLYKLSFDGGFEGNMRPNRSKASELDPDYVGYIGYQGELIIEGWKRARYILVKIRRCPDWCPVPEFF